MWPASQNKRHILVPSPHMAFDLVEGIYNGEAMAVDAALAVVEFYG